MGDVKVTVSIPVGPFTVYKRWLPECLASVRAQTYPADEILIVDDMAGLEAKDIQSEFIHWFDDRLGNDDSNKGTYIWRTPWRLGLASAHNCGVGLARNNLVFLLGCDDTIEPECLELCVTEWEKRERKDAFYYVGAHHIGEAGETVAPDQAAACGAAMVTKELWRMTGGYEAGIIACDWVFLQMLGINFPDRCFPVADSRPLYSARYHSESATSINQRSDHTLRWPTEWGRTS